VPLWRAVAATGAQLLWRVPANRVLGVERALPDGSWRPVPVRGGRPACPAVPGHGSGWSPTPLTIPGGPARASTGWSPTCSTTSGTRPTSWPRACTQRWEEETALDELKTHQRGPGLVLASTSKTPDGVRQQVWAHLLVHHALRALGCRTAGETVLDLGSGGGIDVLLSAHRAGPSGKAYGLDMTEQMLALARRNTKEAGARNVEWLKGHIEQIPLPAGTVDVVISNCVVNLSVDKPAVFAETFRVLKPGGRIGITDVVAEDHLTPEQRAERGSYVGCIAGALSKTEYQEGLIVAGFTEVSVTFTHQVGDGLHSAIVKATKPSGPTTAIAEDRRAELLLASQSGCC
jgi:SAM-dependent methyltransferase